MISPTVTPTLRNTLFTTIPSAGGIPYTDFGRVMDYSTQVGPFTIVDKSGEGNTATLYSGRGLTMDAVNDTVTYATGYSSASRTATLWGKFNTTSPVALLSSGSGSFIFTPTATGVWEELTSTATVEGDLVWDLGLDFDIGDLVIGTEHWTHNDWSDPSGNTSNGKTIVDSGPNQLHGTCTGCSGFTGEGIDPEVAGIVGLDDAQWFNGTDTNVDLGILDVTAYTAIAVEISFSAGLAAGANEFILSILHSGGDDIRVLFDATGALIAAVDDGTAYQLNFGTGYNDGQKHTVNFTLNGSGLSGTVDGLNPQTDALATFNLATAAGDTKIGSRFNDGFPFGEGVIYGIEISNQSGLTHAYTGRGTSVTAWEDTIGSNDGTPSGTFVTVGQKRATIPQTADKNWNKYQWFNGTDSAVTSSNTGLGAGDFFYSVSFLGKINTGSNGTGSIFSDGAAGTGGKRFLVDQADSSLKVQFDDDISLNVITLVTSSVFSDNDLLTLTIERVGSGAGNVSWVLDNQSTGLSYSGSFSDTKNFSSAQKLSFSSLLTVGEVASGWNTNVICNFSAGVSSSSLSVSYTGLGNDPWADTIGSNDGTESGTFTRELVSASDANDQIDALGTAILEPRLNTQQLNLFGEGEYSRTPDSASLDVTTAATIEVWCEPIFLSNERPLISRYGTTGEMSWELQVDVTSARLAFLMAGADGNFQRTEYWSLNTQGTSMLSVTFDGGVVKLYQDAILLTLLGYAGIAAPTTLNAGTLPVIIGGRPVNGNIVRTFGGKFGSAKIYNVALTADEVLTNYNTQKSLYGL